MIYKLKVRATAFLVLLVFSGLIPSFAAEESKGQMLGGSVNSPIRIEVFSDFQCPACRDLYLGTIRQILQDYSSKDKVCVIYHEFPLSMHQYSREAARYSEAASHLGHQNLLMVYDSIFADQAQWSKDGNLDAVLARALPRGEYVKLKKIFRDPNVEVAVNKEIRFGETKGITSTPTMFISHAGKEQKVEGAIAYTLVKQYIDNIIK